MWFEPSADDATRFIGRTGAAAVALDARGAHIDHAGNTLDLAVVDGRPVAPRAEKPLETRVSYFQGSDRSRWRRGVPTFGRVVYPGVRDNVDFVFHGEEGQLEYDFVVHPGGDPGAIALEVSGAGSLATNERGELVMHTAQGDIVQPRPRVFQHGADGKETEVAAAYRVIGHSQIAFELAAYDRSRDLVIDPIVTFSTAFAPTYYESEGAVGVVVGADGSLFVSGGGGNPGHGPHPWTDGYVRKVAPDGSSIAWVTYIGGTASDYATALALDDAGDIYVVGTTRSSDFPLTSNAVPSYSTRSKDLGPRDAFVAKLDSSGVLQHSMLLAGSADDVARGIAVDAQHAAYVIGSTRSADFSTASPLYPAHAGNDDVFVAKVDPTFTSLVFSTFLGGSQNDDGASIALDPAGRVVVAGTTWSADFPTVAGIQSTMRGRSDGFVAWLSADGATLERSTYLGGSGYDNAVGVALDAAGAVYVGGSTDSMDFPILNAAQPKHHGKEEAYVTKLAPGGASIAYSTFMGGSRSELARAIAVTPNGVATIVGSTSSTDLPLVEAVYPALPGFGTSFSAGPWSAGGFIASLAPSGASFSFVSYHVLGSPAIASGVAVGASGELFVTGLGTKTAITKSVGFDGSGIGYTITRIDPTTAKLLPTTSRVVTNARKTFTTQGMHAPLTFSLTQNASGATIGAATGEYVAGTKSGSIDVVRAVDVDGLAATASVVVDAALEIYTTQSSVGAREKMSLFARAGTGGYTWRVVSAPSGGHLVSTSGAKVDYVAGPTAGREAVSSIVDEIELTDSEGNSARVRIPVRAFWILGPDSSYKLHPGESVSLSAVGGGKTRTWTLDSPSGGTLSTSDTVATYRAGVKGDTVDRVAVLDDLGNYAEISLAIGPSIVVSPRRATVAPGYRISFKTLNDAGRVRWRIVSMSANGRVDQNGEYVAVNVGEDTIEVVDALGNMATATVVVTDTPPVSDGNPWTEFTSNEATYPEPPPVPTVETESCNSTGARPSGSRAVLASFLVLALVAWRRRRAVSRRPLA